MNVSKTGNISNKVLVLTKVLVLNKVLVPEQGMLVLVRGPEHQHFRDGTPSDHLEINFLPLSDSIRKIIKLS